jgi:hypothetical protein
MRRTERSTSNESIPSAIFLARRSCSTNTSSHRREPLVFVTKDVTRRSRRPRWLRSIKAGWHSAKARV